jgi:hypothetical protein
MYISFALRMIGEPDFFIIAAIAGFSSGASRLYTLLPVNFEGNEYTYTAESITFVDGNAVLNYSWMNNHGKSYSHDPINNVVLNSGVPDYISREYLALHS